MRRFTVTTLGCKVNQYDSQALAAALQRAGLRPGDDPGDAVDLLVVNTCCITATAMRKSRQAIARLVRGRPDAAVFVTGCYSDYDAGRIRALLGRLNVPPDRIEVGGHHGDLAAGIERLILRLAAGGGENTTGGNGDPRGEPLGNEAWLSGLSDARTNASPETIKTRRLAAVKRNVAGARRLGPIDRFSRHQRAFVKIQDGCDAFCAYCIVPYTRPSVWSRPAETVLDECRRLVAAGHKEIVLCGVFLGAYGRETALRKRWSDEPSALPDLLRRVAELDGLWRVRLSSLEPGDVSDELLAAVAELPTAAPHFHLPLQSGSPEVLRRMNRQYTVDDYRRTVERVREALEDPAITTDVIVGFPGESDEDFDATLKIARLAGFAKIHAFPFSAIPPTAAWSRRHEAPEPDVVKARMAQLAKLERQLADDFRRRFVGRTLEGLVEARRPNAETRRAMTDRYLAVAFDAPDGPAEDDLTGRVVRLKIDRVTAEGLAGRVRQ